MTFSHWGAGPRMGRVSGVLGCSPAHADVNVLRARLGMSLAAAFCRKVMPLQSMVKLQRNKHV